MLAESPGQLVLLPDSHCPAMAEVFQSQTSVSTNKEYRKLFHIKNINQLTARHRDPNWDHQEATLPLGLPQSYEQCCLLQEVTSHSLGLPLQVTSLGTRS